MTLKEAFRYQKFLTNMLCEAQSSLVSSAHAYTVTKIHKKSVANKDAEDVVEFVRPEEFVPNDDVVRFMKWAVAEKGKLTMAINKVKAEAGFDLDAAVEENKARRMMYDAIRSMLRYTSKTLTESGRDYKFNAEGNQMPYTYEIETTFAEAFDRDSAKSLMRECIKKSDEVSSDIDRFLVESYVNYDAMFDVNESFEDVVRAFVKE